LAELSGYTTFEVMDKFNSAYLMHTSVSNFISQMSKEKLIAQLLRESGEPELAKSQLFFTIDALEKRIKITEDNTKDIRDLKFILIRAYAERIACNNEIMLSGRTVSAVMPDFARLQPLAIGIKDDKGSAIGHSLLAGAYYVDNQFEKARENALKALAFLEDDPSLLAETLRGLIIDNTKLNDLNGYKTYETKAIDAIDKGIINTPMDMAAILEGIGQAKTQLGNPDAIYKIEDAEKEMRKLNELKKNRPLRYLQIHRSKLNYYLTMKSLGYTLDYEIVFDSANRAMNSIKTLKDYSRYCKEINRLIEQLDIPHFHKLKQITANNYY